MAIMASAAAIRATAMKVHAEGRRISPNPTIGATAAAKIYFITLRIARRCGVAAAHIHAEAVGACKHHAAAEEHGNGHELIPCEMAAVVHHPRLAQGKGYHNEGAGDKTLLEHSEFHHPYRTQGDCKSIAAEDKAE